jgi:hypothetical protein
LTSFFATTVATFFASFIEFSFRWG